MDFVMIDEDAAIQYAQEHGFLLTNDFETGQAYHVWGELVKRVGIPLVTVSPQQNGQAWVGFAFDPSEHNHRRVMKRARQAIRSCSQIGEEAPDQIMSKLMPGKTSLKLAHKLARLTGFQFPLTDGDIDSVLGREASWQ